MAKKQTTTRNIAFNGYGFENEEGMFYASLNSITSEGIKNITKTYHQNIKLLNSTDYVKLKGKDIVDYTKNNKEALDELYTYGYNEIVQNTKLNTENKDFYIFGAPYKMILDNLQLFGNCGVESVLNNLVTAGIMTIKDQNTTEKNFLKNVWDLGIANDKDTLGILDREDGGTTVYDQKEIFDLYGINSSIYNNYNNVNHLANLIKNGYGVVLSVCSSRLWWGRKLTDETLDHSISVIGVVYENENPALNETPIAFVIHDTGYQMTRFIAPEQLKYAALYDVTYTDNNTLANKHQEGFTLIVTQEAIKTNTDNVNATGDKFENIIYGNLGNNIIKGLGGNDTLYGDDGNDTIYGGDGNDIIYGGYGKDTLYGNNGDDIIYGEYGNNTIYGGNGNDTIYSGDGKNIIYGGAGNDIIYGGEDRNVIYGDNGNDKIYGGSWNDRIFGGSGNDTIDGGDGNDTIIAGSGNDTIIASLGNDKIEVGSGNDTVIFNDPNNNAGFIYNSSGSITLEYTYDINEYNMMPILGYTKSNIYSLNNMNTITGGSIVLENFFNYKTNKVQTVYLINNANDENKKRKYIISATKSANARVANIGLDAKNKDINNILYTTNKAGTTVTTSKKNDIIFMYAGPDIEYSEAEYTRKDNITYTGGKDTYISLIGNTTYIVGFNENTVLQITDNISPISKVKVDEYGNPYIYELEPSKNDVIKFSSSLDNISFFFDMDNEGKITENTSLFALYKTDENEETIQNNMTNIAKLDKELSGVVALVGYFKEGATFGSNEYYGNGLIEEIYTKEDNRDTLYSGLGARIDTIKSSVLNWLEANNDYSSVFEALSAEETPENIAALIQCYTQNT